MFVLDFLLLVVKASLANTLKSFFISSLSAPSPCSQHIFLLDYSILLFSLFLFLFSIIILASACFVSTHSAQTPCCTAERNWETATYSTWGAPRLVSTLCTLVMQSLVKSPVTVPFVCFKGFLYTSSKIRFLVFFPLSYYNGP